MGKKIHGLDPITFEVLQHRLWMLNDEQAKTAIRISGSAVVYDINDFSASLLTPDGESLFVGTHVTRLANSLHIINKNIILLFKESPGINEGDMFITNDPWIGAAHHNDFAILAPVFWKGEIICWTGIAMHEIDVGGPSSLSTRARDAFEEPPIIPPLKLVERGVFRTDVERLLLRNTRTPALNSLDLRARIAAQHVTRERIYEIVQEFGKEAFLQVQQMIKQSVAKALRRRLKELPDGVWREEGFIDHDGHENRLFRLVLTMTKKGNRLTLDFRGTDKQAPGTVNCAPPGLYGGIFSALLPMMCYDLPWCPAGLHEVVEVISEEGTLNNARFPAAVGVATVSAMWATGDLVRSCLAKIYAASKKYQKEVQANWAPGFLSFMVTGYHKDEPTQPILNLFSVSGGGGARGWADGLDSAGPPGAPGMRIANVESDEKEGLIMVLYRRQCPETFGPGLWRGGAGLECAFMPYDCEGSLQLGLYSQGFDHPEGRGVYGGFPSSVQVSAVLRRVCLSEFFQRSYLPSSWEEIPYEELELLEAKQVTSLNSTDMAILISAGGGGYGDPLERNPDLVRQDFECLICSRPEEYGVVLKAGKVDLAATEDLRLSLKNDRLRRGQAVTTINQTKLNGTHLFDVAHCFRVIKFEEDELFTCIKCGYTYGPKHQDPKKTSLIIKMDPDELSPLNRYCAKGEETVIYGFCCPECGLLHGVQVRKKEDPILFDMNLGDTIQR